MTTERFQLSIGGIVADVTVKSIRNLHIGVYPPEGTVRVAAPTAMDRAAIHNAVALRLPWIRRQVRVFESQPRESPRVYQAGESHWFNGRRYRLRIAGHHRRARVSVHGDYICVEVRGDQSAAKTARALERWRRTELQARADPLVTFWSNKLGVRRPEIGVKRMHTRWGSCSPNASRIWLNLTLSRTWPRCLEYVIIHELTHFLHRAHNRSFTATLDQHLPGWRDIRDSLSELAYEAVGPAGIGEAGEQTSDEPEVADKLPRLGRCSSVGQIVASGQKLAPPALLLD